VRKREERERNTTSSPPKRFRGLLPTLWHTQLRQETDGKRILHPLPLECSLQNPLVSLCFPPTSKIYFSSHYPPLSVEVEVASHSHIVQSDHYSLRVVPIARQVLIFLAFVLLHLPLSHLLSSTRQIGLLSSYHPRATPVPSRVALCSSPRSPSPASPFYALFSASPSPVLHSPGLCFLILLQTHLRSLTFLRSLIHPSSALRISKAKNRGSAEVSFRGKGGL